nr:PREDICTED: zinc finger protein 36, C3H1 type-like 1 [Lepisosteus oculatus]
MLFGEQAREDLLLPPSPEGAEDVLFRRGAPLWGGGSLAEALLPLVETPPAPAAPRPCYLRYKTELCSRYAAAGACRYAERCQFAHGLRELRVPARHPKYKTEPCRAFHTAGVCPYGARCLFVHAPEELRVPGARPRAATAPCRTYLAFGVCPYGARCHFLHADGKPQGPPEKGAERGRPSLCRTFLAFGFCLYGTGRH